MADNLDLIGQSILRRCLAIFEEISLLDEDQRITILNELRRALHERSPFRAEPVDCILWVKGETIEGNPYNPNAVAPPEMRLLEHSIREDGYTQPIVTWVTDGGGRREVVDGFHRNRIGKESPVVRKRTRGYLPVTTINEWREDYKDRVAATIRHNRARGKHQVAAMSEIVVELSRRNWSDEKIGRELGMEPDEVLRLKQISGLAELFADREFSEAWEIVGDGDVDDPA
jgi:ParB-like chromosome segregation protein Spo0J